MATPATSIGHEHREAGERAGHPDVEQHRLAPDPSRMRMKAPSLPESPMKAGSGRK